MKKTTNQRDISAVAPLITMVIFSVCILLVLLFGARLYKNTLQRDSIGFDRRTIDHYLTTRIRQCDGEGQFFVGDFATGMPEEQGDTLYYVETIEGERYFTRIYCHDGALYELFTCAEDVVERADGERIRPLSRVEFRMENGMLHACITHADGSQDRLQFYLRSMEGGSDEK